MLIVENTCQYNGDLLKELEEEIAKQGNNFLHSNIYGLKKNFSQKRFNKLLAFKQILSVYRCCIDRTLYTKIIEKIRTEI